MMWAVLSDSDNDLLLESCTLHPLCSGIAHSCPKDRAKLIQEDRGISNLYRRANLGFNSILYSGLFQYGKRFLRHRIDVCLFEMKKRP